jgi:hypothetical protein
MKIIAVTCTRCSGSGHFSFNLTRGTVCFGCNGSGLTQTTEDKIATAKLAKVKSDALKAAKKVALDERIYEYNLQLTRIQDIYKNDPRIGRMTNAQCQLFPAVAQQTYALLDMVDTGKYLHSIDHIAI